MPGEIVPLDFVTYFRGINLRSELGSNKILEVRMNMIRNIKFLFCSFLPWLFCVVLIVKIFCVL